MADGAIPRAALRAAFRGIILVRIGTRTGTVRLASGSFAVFTLAIAGAGRGTGVTGGWLKLRRFWRACFLAEAFFEGIPFRTGALARRTGDAARGAGLAADIFLTNVLFAAGLRTIIFFTGCFLAAAFFATDFTAGFFGAAFFTGAFLTIAFLFAAFLTADFLAPVFFKLAFLMAAFLRARFSGAAFLEAA